MGRLACQRELRKGIEKDAAARSGDRNNTGHKGRKAGCKVKREQAPHRHAHDEGLALSFGEFLQLSFGRAQPVEVAGRFQIVRGCAVSWKKRSTDRKSELIVQSPNEMMHDLRGRSERMQNENPDIATLNGERLRTFHHSYHEVFLLVVAAA